MDNFLRLMRLVMRFVNTPINVLGYTFSYFDVILFVLVFCLVCYLIGVLL